MPWKLNVVKYYLAHLCLMEFPDHINQTNQLRLYPIYAEWVSHSCHYDQSIPALKGCRVMFFTLFMR